MFIKTEAELKYIGKSDKRYPINDIQAFIKKIKKTTIYTQ